MGSTHAELPFAREPRVSIVILAWRNAARLRRCLASIQAHPGSAPTETVVVANGASAEVVSALSETGGIRTVHSEVNLGFAGGCNLGAQHARGDLLVLLNDDVEVQPGWLDALVATADAHPGAGAIGSRMTFTDGTLHEAGQIVWRDGSTTAVGRGLPGDTRRWRYLRQVDYCSAASLLVRRSAWLSAGAMDPAFHPGYCEDVDLCFAIQETGARILYQPRSVICHHEGSSFDSVWRDFLMERNRRRLVAKWADRLASHEPGLGRPGAFERAIHLARGFPRRVLAVVDRLPAPSTLERTWLGRLVADLDLVRNAVVVATSAPSEQDQAGPLEALGVEVVEEPPGRHLARPETIYDAVVLDPACAALEETVHSQQPHAAVLLAEPALLAGVTGSWQDAIAAAQLGRRPAREPGLPGGVSGRRAERI